MSKHVLALFLSVCLVLGACGDDTDSDASTAGEADVVDDGSGSPDAPADETDEMDDSVDDETDAPDAGGDATTDTLAEGDDGGDAGGGVTGDSTPAEDGEDPPPDVPAEFADDQASAERAIAAFNADLGSRGFQVDSSQDEEGEDDDFEFESEECQRFDEALNRDELPGETADVEGDSYSRGEFSPVGGSQEQVNGFVGMTQTAEQQDETYGFLKDDALGPCLQEAFEQAIEEESGGATVENVKVVNLGPAGVGDDGAGWSVSGEIVAGELRIPFVFEVRFERVGRATVGVFVAVVGANRVDYDAVGGLGLLADNIGGSQ